MFLLKNNEKYYSLKGSNSNENAIPVMTSNTTPKGIASASVSRSGDLPYKAFDNDDTMLWVSATTSNVWLQYEFEKQCVISKYGILPNSTTNQSPKDFEFQGSNDNTNFVVLDTRSSITYSSSTEPTYFEFDNTTEYKIYRLLIKANGGNSVLSVNRLLMFEKNLGLLELNNPTKQNILDFGMKNNFTIDLTTTLQRKYKLVNGVIEEVTTSPYSLKNEFSESIEVVEFSDLANQKFSIVSSETNPFSVYDYIGENPQVLIYTETTNDLMVSTTVEPYSVYDYISETPTVIAYTESTVDIIIRTTTEPFELLDELDGEVEVLFYTDNETVTETDLILEANWSPVDELDGDFEVVTWTDESTVSARRLLNLTGVPKGQFVKFDVPKTISSLKGISAKFIEESKVEYVRFLLSNDNITWEKWTGSNFEIVDASTSSLILQNGNVVSELNSITASDFNNHWKSDKISVGIYLEDDIREDYTSAISELLMTELSPVNSPKITNASLYILNTTATINVELNGSTLTGTVSDADLTRVQYRVILNGKPYYPMTGEFTNLAEPPVNINLSFPSSDIKINDWNDLTVEFRDYFGTTDSWKVQFLGEYSGLMFRTVDGQYYSSDVGAILKYLDFGLIIAGKTTTEHEIVLKNEYGYTIKDVLMNINKTVLPSGVKVEFKKEGSTVWSDRLDVADTMMDDDEIKFNIRMVTEVTAEPRESGAFDIYVTAKKE